MGYGVARRHNENNDPMQEQPALVAARQQTIQPKLNSEASEDAQYRLYCAMKTILVWLHTQLTPPFVWSDTRPAPIGSRKGTLIGVTE